MKNLIIIICLLIIAIAVASCEKGYTGQSQQSVLTVKDSTGKVIGVHPVADGDNIQVGKYLVNFKSAGDNYQMNYERKKRTNIRPGSH